MALDPSIRQRLTLPAICAPMFRISNPALVREACKSGIVGALPSHNAKDFAMFEAWLDEISEGLRVYADENPGARIGPIAVNLSRMAGDAMTKHLDLCAKHGVEIIISAMGDPSELIARVHDWGGKVFHDVTNFRFAEKAIEAKVDGLTCIGSGGGGHSGLISHIAFIPKVRAMFDGTIIMAGCISTGATIRAAEILGADLAYLGTRFIATQEANAPDAYKAMLVSSAAKDLIFTPQVAGGAANWLKPSLVRVGIDPDNLPVTPPGAIRPELPEGAVPWKTIWSAGQGVELIDDVPSVAELVTRLRREYVVACDAPSFADVARLVDQALDAKSAD
ncbi:MAG: NAD(P)H-dependent flavin oxidoreductase [Sphingomonas sp.]